MGNPIGFHLTPGLAHDLAGADVLLPRLPEQTGALIADKAYDAKQRMIEPLERAQMEIVIPSRSGAVTPREIDRHLYKRRHLIENFFARLKQYRAIATRYDKRATVFLGAIYLAASIIWLN